MLMFSANNNLRWQLTRLKTAVIFEYNGQAVRQLLNKIRQGETGNSFLYTFYTQVNAVIDNVTTLAQYQLSNNIYNRYHNTKLLLNIPVATGQR